MEMVQFIGYAPDIDPATPGVLTGGTFDVTPRGIRTAGGFVRLYAPVGGVSSTNEVDGRPYASPASDVSKVIYWGVRNVGIYETVNGVSTLRSTVQGDGSGINFCRFGQSMLAARAAFSGVQILVQPTLGANFRAPLALPAIGNFSAQLVATASNFGLAFGSYLGGGGQQDNWYCSALGNIDDWVPSVTTQANAGRLQSSDGAIRAAMGLGDRCIAYKSRETWIGTYVGSPEVWRWERITGFGAAGQNAVCDIGGAHFVVSNSDIYIFDGVRPVSVASGAVQLEMSRNNINLVNEQVSVSFDESTKTVYVQLKPVDPNSPIWSYNLDSKRWGLVGGLTAAGWLFPVENSSFDKRNDRILGFVFRASGEFAARTRATNSNGLTSEVIPRNLTFTTNVVGTSDRQFMAKEFRWRLPTNGTMSSVTCEAYNLGQNPAGTPTTSTTVGVSASQFKADFRLTGYWFKFSGTVQPATTATNPLVNHELTHYGADLKQVGKR